jgi:hypothetical protein
MAHGKPFGMSAADFESATRTCSKGFIAADEEFRAFLKTDFQIVDGEIEAWAGESPGTCIMRIDCEDATQWEITTDVPELVEKLQSTGCERLY